MHVTVGAVPLTQLGSQALAESTESIRSRVACARSAQQRRFARQSRMSCNAHAPGRWMDAHGNIDAHARAMLERAAIALSLSARSYHRVLKVARTIADIDRDEKVMESHVAEALRYRPVPRAL